ncbi:signal peptidase I [Abditibacteriota bacterium]|nr:signal peptidase I [Abditibacteriota bacterium]
MQIGSFNMDSWPWKIAVVAALIGIRELIRLLSPKDPKDEGSETSKWLVETIDSAAIAIGLVLFIIQPFILQAFFIPSGSMEDTLRISDRLLVSKLIYRMKAPAFQDVIVFKAPKAAFFGQNQTEDVDFIKRCIGTPGDIIEVKDRKLYRNGKLVEEVYTKWNNLSPSITNGTAPDELTSSQENLGHDSYDMKIVGGAVYSRDYESPGHPGTWKQNNLLSPPDDQGQDEITKAAPGKVPAGKYLFLGDHRSNSNDGHVWGFAPRENIVGKAICVFWPPTRLGLVDHMSFAQKGGDN